MTGEFSRTSRDGIKRKRAGRSAKAKGDDAVTSRIFDGEAHRAFALFSGDFNPIHMDPEFARRTQAGSVVIHGAHTVLWALEAYFSSVADPVSPRSLHVVFPNSLYVGDAARVTFAPRGEADGVLEVTANNARICRVALSRAPARGLGGALDGDDGPLFAPDRPLDRPLDALIGEAGRLAFVRPDLARELFPTVADRLGEGFVNAVGGMTRLVGMVSPGLYSMFASMALELTGDGPSDGLLWRTISVDPQFRMVRHRVAAGGVQGVLESFARDAPVLQPLMAEVAQVVPRDAFRGHRVLVVGGSRGLGEVVAKLAAAGGASVTITYATGAADAQRVRDEIVAWGGRCQVCNHVAGASGGPELPIAEAPTHVYYFASTTIARRKSALFDLERLADFNRIYNDGFFELCSRLSDRFSEKFVAVYPSTVFVTEHDNALVEYAMSKAAGEVLCDKMSALMGNVRAVHHRLPRMYTDQTAGVTRVSTVDVLDTLAPFVRHAQSL